MTLTLDFSGDFTVWDGVEPIRFESTQRASPILDVVASAKRRALTARELAASGGVYTGQDLVWLLPVRLLTQAVPKPADVVVDSASQTRWTVLSTQLGKWQQTWKLTCRDLILANALWDTVSIERAALSYDAAGAAVKTWPPAAGQVLYRSLPAECNS